MEKTYRVATGLLIACVLEVCPNCTPLGGDPPIKTEQWKLVSHGTTIFQVCSECHHSIRNRTFYGPESSRHAVVARMFQDTADVNTTFLTHQSVPAMTADLWPHKSCLPEESDPEMDYRTNPPVRAYPPREVPWTERETWGR